MNYKRHKKKILCGVRGHYCHFRIQLLHTNLNLKVSFYSKSNNIFGVKHQTTENRKVNNESPSLA